MIDTKQKILDTAERLFASQGLDATSLRQIISEAGVNLAAIHYHFGSKDELVSETIARKVGPVNEQRLARLERVESEAGDHAPSLEKILEALMLPMTEAADRNPQFVRLMGRIHAEGMMPQIVTQHFRPVVIRFMAALRRALPDLPEDEFAWRVHFTIGAMAHTMCGTPTYAPVNIANSDFHGRIRRLITFLNAGFHAPVTQIESVEVNQ